MLPLDSATLRRFAPKGGTVQWERQVFFVNFCNRAGNALPVASK